MQGKELLQPRAQTQKACICANRLSSNFIFPVLTLSRSNHGVPPHSVYAAPRVRNRGMSRCSDFVTILDLELTRKETGLRFLRFPGEWPSLLPTRLTHWKRSASDEKRG